MHLTKFTSVCRRPISFTRAKTLAGFKSSLVTCKPVVPQTYHFPSQMISASSLRQFSTNAEKEDMEGFDEDDTITMKALLSTPSGEDWKYINKIKDGQNVPITIRYTRTSGRGLFTNQEGPVYEEGSVIFEEKPFAANPVNDTDFCNNCLQTLSSRSFKLPSGSFITLDASIKEEPEVFTKHPKIIKASSLSISCPHCEQVKFCSTSCSAEALTKHHSILCHRAGSSPWRTLENMCKDSDTKIPLLVARIFSILIQEIIDKKVQVKRKNNKIELSGGSWEFLQRLGSQEEMLDMETFQTELDLLKQMFMNHDIVTEDIYKTLKAACYSNSSQLEIQTETLINTDSNQAITRTEFPLHGSFLPFFGAFINHSCEPNITANPQHNYMVNWTATRKISPGEELTTSYVPRDLPFEDRREMLWNHWGFWCTCPRCKREETEDILNK